MAMGSLPGGGEVHAANAKVVIAAIATPTIDWLDDISASPD
jgi:hypothetical protein